MLQPRLRSSADSSRSAETRRANLEEIERLVDEAVALSPGARLIVLPAIAVTGAFPENGPDGYSASLPLVPGPEVESLGRLAAKHSLYLAGGLLEHDPAQPDNAWNAGVILGPKGDLLLHARQIQPEAEPFLAWCASPADDEAGDAGSTIFPVVDTEIGRLACCIGADAAQAEIARTLALRGAELVCHLGSDLPSHHRDASRLSLHDRAWTSNIFWLTANPGVHSNDGGADVDLGARSEIIDFTGRPIAVTGSGRSFAAARIDLESMRSHRARVDPTNFLPQLKTAVHVEAFRPRSPKIEPPPAPPPYAVACMQTDIHYTEDLRRREEILSHNIDHTVNLMSVAGGMARIMVFPEHWLQGFDTRYTHADWQQVAITTDGPEVGRLREAAAKNGLYICGSIFEKHADWPDRFFNAGIIIDPNGDVILRHRKHNCMNLPGALADTTPGDIYTEWVRRYGEDAGYPVVATPLGVLGCIVSFEDNMPEHTRALALRGAEVILQPLDENNIPSNIARSTGRRTRAFENICYWVSSNIGSATRERLPRLNASGSSEIIDFNGDIQVRGAGPGESIIRGEIDIGALRRRRADEPNQLRQVRSDLWARTYAEVEACPIDVWGSAPIREAKEGAVQFRKNIESLTVRGVFAAPSG